MTEGRFAAVMVLRRHALAVVLGIGFLLLRLASGDALGPGVPFVQSYPAIILSAWCAGPAAGLTATAVSAAGVWYVLAPLEGAASAIGTAPLVAFIIMGVLVSVLVGWTRASRQAALQSEQRYRRLLDLTPVAVFIEYRDRIVYANEATRRVLQTSSDASPIGQSPLAFVHPEDRAAVEARIADLRAGRVDRVPWIEERWLTANGETVFVEAAAAVVPWEGGTAIQVLVRDISEQKRARDEREELLRAVSQASRAKDEFLALVSHEMRTPLNVALGWTRVLRKGLQTSPAQLARALEIIERNTEAQKMLVQKVLDLTTMLGGQLHLDRAPVDLARLLTSACASVAPAARAKETTLTVTVPDTPAFVTGDSVRLRQALEYVLDNAIKFTPDGGRIDVVLQAPDDVAAVTVADTGQGIAPEFIPFAFEPFRQDQDRKPQAVAGLGLGLPLVRHLVQLHGGRVDLASPGVGLGATVTITLPLDRPWRVAPLDMPQGVGASA